MGVRNAQMYPVKNQLHRILTRIQENDDKPRLNKEGFEGKNAGGTGSMSVIGDFHIDGLLLLIRKLLKYYCRLLNALHCTDCRIS